MFNKVLVLGMVMVVVALHGCHGSATSSNSKLQVASNDQSVEIRSETPIKTVPVTNYAPKLDALTQLTQKVKLLAEKFDASTDQILLANFEINKVFTIFNSDKVRLQALTLYKAVLESKLTNSVSKRAVETYANFWVSVTEDVTELPADALTVRITEMIESLKVEDERQRCQVDTNIGTRANLVNYFQYLCSLMDLEKFKRLVQELGSPDNRDLKHQIDADTAMLSDKVKSRRTKFHTQLPAESALDGILRDFKTLSVPETEYTRMISDSKSFDYQDLVTGQVRRLRNWVDRRMAEASVLNEVLLQQAATEYLRGLEINGLKNQILKLAADNHQEPHKVNERIEQCEYLCYEHDRLTENLRNYLRELKATTSHYHDVANRFQESRRIESMDYPVNESLNLSPEQLEKLIYHNLNEYFAIDVKGLAQYPMLKESNIKTEIAKCKEFGAVGNLNNLNNLILTASRLQKDYRAKLAGMFETVRSKKMEKALSKYQIGLANSRLEEEIIKTATALSVTTTYQSPINSEYAKLALSVCHLASVNERTLNGNLERLLKVIQSEICMRTESTRDATCENTQKDALADLMSVLSTGKLDVLKNSIQQNYVLYGHITETPDDGFDPVAKSNLEINSFRSEVPSDVGEFLHALLERVKCQIAVAQVKPPNNLEKATAALTVASDKLYDIRSIPDIENKIRLNFQELKGLVEATGSNLKLPATNLEEERMIYSQAKLKGWMVAKCLRAMSSVIDASIASLKAKSDFQVSEESLVELENQRRLAVENYANTVQRYSEQ